MTCQLNPLHPLEVPTVFEAVAFHEAAHGPLTRESTYGVDPIHASVQLQVLRARDFKSAYPSFEAIFSDILHNNGNMFREAILLFISLSLCFSELLL